MSFSEELEEVKSNDPERDMRISHPIASERCDRRKQLGYRQDAVRNTVTKLSGSWRASSTGLTSVGTMLTIAVRFASLSTDALSQFKGVGSSERKKRISRALGTSLFCANPVGLGQDRVRALVAPQEPSLSVPIQMDGVRVE
jgi:hypothetical protein